jgi:hypothetical protein
MPAESGSLKADRRAVLNKHRKSYKRASKMICQILVKSGGEIGGIPQIDFRLSGNNLLRGFGLSTLVLLAFAVVELILNTTARVVFPRFCHP